MELVRPAARRMAKKLIFACRVYHQPSPNADNYLEGIVNSPSTGIRSLLYPLVPWFRAFPNWQPLLQLIRPAEEQPEGRSKVNVIN